MSMSETLWETRAQFGFHCGISIALHLPHGQHLVLGMGRDKRLPSGPKLAFVQANLSLLATHTLGAMQRLFVASTNSDLEIGSLLTSRELDILRLLERRESKKSIASALRVSNNTIEFHLKNVFRKLERRRRGAAVSKALQYGLV